MSMTDLQLEVLDYEDTMLAVKQGAALLDEVYPKWEQAITIDHLFLESAGSCVLGQLASEYTGGEHADYFSMLTELEAEGHIESTDDAEAIEYGFCLKNAHNGNRRSVDHTNTAWNDLTRTWRAFITDRRGY